MCDSKRAHSSCSGPEGSSLKRLASFCDGVLDSLQTVINRVQFHGINLRLGANCAPVVEALLESLLSEAQSLCSESLPSFLAAFCSAPQRDAFFVGLLGRWSSLIGFWQKGKHCYVPFDLTCRDGFCISCFTRCPNFAKRLASFCGRPCSSRPLNSEANDARTISFWKSKNFCPVFAEPIRLPLMT